MTAYITENLPKAEKYLRDNRLRDALALLQAMSEQARTVSITDDIKRIGQSYALMLGYLCDGTADPSRGSMHEALIADAYRILDRLRRRVEANDRPTLYYDALRYRARMRGQLPDLASRVNDYIKAVDRLSIFNMAAGASAGDTDERYRLEDDIFTYIWTVYPLSGADAESVRLLLTSDAVPSDFRIMTISALMLGLLEFADENRMLLLADTYAGASDNESAMAALTGLVLGLHKYRARPVSAKLRDRISALADSPAWHSDLAALQLELIRARDTERINNRMQNEVIPQMMKLRPDILRKINDTPATEDANLDGNPEWERLIDESGLRDKLKEFGELQMEGSDVMMSTFSRLKTYPFFHSVANWFRPFRSEHPAVRSIIATSLPPAMADLLEHAAVLCDSDKYSLVLTVAHIPEQQLRPMFGQLEAQATNMAEAAAAMAGGTDRKTAVNSYLHNIYRFYKLFRRRGEFYDPFAGPLNLIGCEPLSGYLDDEPTLSLIAELYLRFHTYDQALDAFRHLQKITPPSSQTFQKTGYCLEQLGRYGEAFDVYRQAELFDANSAWTLRRLASTARRSGDLPAAASYYARLAEILPDDKNVALNLANVYAEQEMYAESISQYFKANFMDERDLRPVRALAWCLFVTGDYERSRRYFDRVLAEDPRTDDYLNAGHLCLAAGDMPGAISYYRKSVEAGDGSFESFVSKMSEDAKYLEKAGIDLRDLPVIADAVFYSLE